MKHGAKMAFDCLKLAQDGRKLDPRWPKIGPRRGQKGDNAKLYVEGSYQPAFRTVLQGAAGDAHEQCVDLLEGRSEPAEASLGHFGDILGPPWGHVGHSGTIVGLP